VEGEFVTSLLAIARLPSVDNEVRDYGIDPPISRECAAYLAPGGARPPRRAPSSSAAHVQRFSVAVTRDHRATEYKSRVQEES
jgi:hypothetical protein